MAAETAPTRAPIATRDEAERFVASFGATIAALQSLLVEETGHLSAGRLREGLAQETRKAELAASYLQGLERARANAVALARFAPRAVAALREAHGPFRATVERNQAVIATARAVSEGLVRGVAAEVARQTRPQTYGAIAASRATAPKPIVLSTRA